MFGSKRGGVTGGWRKLRNEELHNLYSSVNIIRMIKLRNIKFVGDVVLMVDTSNWFEILVWQI
jgi:hypothetical protein